MIETSIVLECPGCRRVGDRTVEAWAEPGVAGLVVSRTHKHPAEGGWVVDHLTGFGRGAIQFGPTVYEKREQAETALHLLGLLPVDWRLPADDPRFRDPVLVAVMSDAIGRALGIGLNLDLPGAEP